MCVLASTTTVTVGSLTTGRFPHRSEVHSLLCPPTPTPPSQTALSRGPSTPHEQRRQCGPSGRASSRHRTTQSNSHILRGTSRTCSLWVTPALESPQTLFLFLFLKITLVVSRLWSRMCCLYWTSLPTSTTMTLRFPSTPSLTSDLVRPSVTVLSTLLPSVFLFFFFPALLRNLSALHGSNCTAQLSFIYTASGHRRCSMRTLRL